MPNESTTSGIRLDPADPEFAQLLKGAGRIAALFRIADDRKDEFLRYTVDLCLGAVYALAIAKYTGYEHRTGPAEHDKPPLRARDMESGWLRTDGKWIAGFHFNSGILRIAAVYHRSLKIAVGRPTSKDYAPVLRPIAKRLFSTWTDTNAFAVHEEVNMVKHDANGLLVRTVTPAHGVKALDEVLALLETWANAGPWPAA